ncbi:DoxX family protein [Leclercia sp. J807]|uniref:DoxX family protein n=1 Tax=Leclercia sp. J807 TaxID=2681307 RepID=UPI001E2B56AE|nr:DoxX family protein [Leclercia sp. J807]
MLNHIGIEMTVFLRSAAALIIARIVLTSFFWMAGLFGLFNFGEIAQEMAGVGLPLPAFFAILTILCQLAAPAVIILNPKGYGWLGAGALIIFTLLTIPLGHAFWRFEEPMRTAEFHIFLEHISLTGGMMMAAILAVRK